MDQSEELRRRLEAIENKLEERLFSVAEKFLEQQSETRLEMREFNNSIASIVNAFDKHAGLLEEVSYRIYEGNKQLLSSFESSERGASNELERLAALEFGLNNLDKQSLRLGNELGELVSQHVETLERHIRNIEDTINKVQMKCKSEEAISHSYFATLQSGVKLDEVRLFQFLPARVYISSDREEDIQGVTAALGDFLHDIGFRYADEYPAQSGSWFKQWYVKSKEAITKLNVSERLKKGERALELQYISSIEAETDKAQAEGAATLIRAVETHSNAVCQIGSILLVKQTNKNGESSIVTRTLSQLELEAIERSPSALMEPEQVFGLLENLPKHEET